MNLAEKYKLNSDQVKACARVKRAVKAAAKLGVSIYAKSDTLIGMSTKAFEDKVVCPLHQVVERADYENPVPAVDAGKIVDAGADDTDFFYKNEYLK